MSTRAVFLDRDGVLNRALVREGKPYPPQTLADFAIPPETSTALGRLRKAGFQLIVVTNQPDVARGAQKREVVEQMHSILSKALPLDDILVCWHDDDAGCECRKPKPGLMLQAAQKYGLELSSSFLVGDRWRDVEAGGAAGCRTVWIDYGYRERRPACNADARVESFEQAVTWILTEVERGKGEKAISVEN